jgi:hypothetical protein
MAGNQGQGHIFISYRRVEPDMGFAYRLADDLYAAGHPVWIDVAGIEGGEVWTEEIQRGIDECYAYLIVLSPDSLASRWVRNELLYTLREKGDRVYPVMFRAVKLPPELIAIQYIDFQGDYQAALARLLATLPPPQRGGPQLPQDLEVALRSAMRNVRRGAVDELIEIARGDNPDLAALAHERLDDVARNDPDEHVREAARHFVGGEASRPARKGARQTASPAPRPSKTRPAPHHPPTRRFNPLWIGAGVIGIGLLVGLLALLRGPGEIPSTPTDQPASPPLTSATAPPVASPILDPTLVSSSILTALRVDDFSSSDSGWDDYQHAQGWTGYQNGRYLIDLDDRRFFLSVWSMANDADNTVLQVDVLGPWDDSAVLSQGIGFGWHAEWAGTAYAFTVDPNGECRFWDNTADTDWITKQAGSVAGFDEGLSQHTVAVVIENGEALGYVDGVFCTRYALASYEPGVPGVVALGPGKATFDDYFVYVFP